MNTRSHNQWILAVASRTLPSSLAQEGSDSHTRSALENAAAKGASPTAIESAQVSKVASASNTHTHQAGASKFRPPFLVATLGAALALGMTMPSFAGPAAPANLSEAAVASALREEPAQKTVMQRRFMVKKASHTSIKAGFSSEAIQVKFAENAAIEIRGGRFESTEVEVDALNKVLDSVEGVKIEPTFKLPKTPVDFRAEKAALERQSHHDLADLSLYFTINLRGSTIAESEKLLDALNALPIVESAQPVPKMAPPPASADYYQSQRYLGAAPSGIGANTVNGIAGVRGDYVQIFDIEFSWNFNHEDLAKARASGAFIANGTPDLSYDSTHGTGVIGELIATNNGLGVTGIAYNSRLRMVNAAVAGTSTLQDLANAIYLAAANATAGDVILIEQQIAYPGGVCSETRQDGCVPVESNDTIFDAIRYATTKGIIVIEPAANGGQNLDIAAFSAWNRRDSGAIMVGAGAGISQCAWWEGKPSRSRLSFSNYGAILDVQGWGECVATTGKGDASGGTDPNAFYTYLFSGTSSASPIVAGAAAAYSSVMEARTGQHPTSQQVRQALQSTGTAQDMTSAGVLGGRIGPLPNLQAALSNTDTTAPTVAAPTEHIELGTLGTTVPTTITWSASDASGIRSYELWVSTNGGGFVQDTAVPATATARTYLLAAGTTYRFFVRAYDNAGNYSPDAAGYGLPIKMTLTDDRATAVKLYMAPGTTTSTWVYASYAQAYKSTVTKSARAKESAKFTFTGRDVAFVASKGTNRGNTQVFLDGVFSQNVQLYSTANSGSQIVYWAHWPTSGTHSIEVDNRAVAGYPTAIDLDAFIVSQ